MERVHDRCAVLDYCVNTSLGRVSNPEASLKMIWIAKYSGQKVGVLGLGITGISAVESLNRSGVNVSVWDDCQKRRLLAENLGFSVIDFRIEGLGNIDLLFVSPGIPLAYPEPHPIVGLARRNGVKIVSDMELLQQSCPNAHYIGVTGTNGKSTVTSLIGHLLRHVGGPVQVGGNLGKPALGLEMLDEGGTYVLELSSYQLDLIKQEFFNVAVWTNLSPDHIDRHGTFNNYFEAKKKIFSGNGGHAIIGVDDEISLNLFQELKAENNRLVIPVSAGRHVKNGVSVASGVLCDDIDSRSRQVMDVTNIATLRGVHNWRNIGLAYAAVRAAGLSSSEFVENLGTYPGLPHRLEVVGIYKGVTYVNDSKATNLASAASALSCFQSIYWIMGGRAKDVSVVQFASALSRVVHAFTIGESGKVFAEMLEGRVPVINSKSLAAAVGQATSLALSNTDTSPVVLLSPGCASFDQFANFEARGRAFCDIVAELHGSTNRDIRTNSDGIVP